MEAFCAVSRTAEQRMSCVCDRYVAAWIHPLSLSVPAAEPAVELAAEPTAEPTAEPAEPSSRWEKTQSFASTPPLTSSVVGTRFPAVCASR